MGQQHIVPLSRRDVAVFKQLRKINGSGSLVFQNQVDCSMADLVDTARDGAKVYSGPV